MHNMAMDTLMICFLRVSLRLCTSPAISALMARALAGMGVEPEEYYSERNKGYDVHQDHS